MLYRDDLREDGYRPVRAPEGEIYSEGELWGRAQTDGYEAEFTEGGEFYERGKYRGTYSVIDLGCVLVRYAPGEKHLEPHVPPRGRSDAEERSPVPYGYARMIGGEIRLYLFGGYHFSDPRRDVSYVVLE